MSDVTQILGAIERGDPNAAEQLLPLVYDELRTLAAQKMAQEKPGQTLEATALVHEAYLRLTGDQHFDNRGHFFAAAAEAMRRILVDNARRKASGKHGGKLTPKALDPDEIANPERADDLLALDEALDRLQAFDPAVAGLVRLRYFAGLTIREAATALGIAPRIADGYWAYAKVLS
jgi:RNA polymerase sigma factor (TIGR02999 family)